MEETERLSNANQTVKNHMMMSISTGLIPIPIVDLVALSGIQMKMLYKLTQSYEISFSKNRGKSLMSALVGGILPTYATAGVVGSLSKFIPLGGTATGMITMSAFGGASTYAIGKVFIKHFEAGGTLLTFDPTKMREYFAAQFKKGKEQVKAQKEEPLEQEAMA
jgi:uncharacterized protein (DUF697 family)